LAVAVAVSSGNTGLLIFKRTGDTFSLLPTPANTPTGGYVTCEFDLTGEYLAAGYGAAPNLIVFRRSVDTFTKLDTLPAVSGGGSVGISISPGGVYITHGHNSGNRLTIFKRTNNSFATLTTPSAASVCWHASFSPDDIYLAYTNGSNCDVFRRTNDSFAKVATLPAQGIEGVAWSPDSRALTLTCNTAPFVYFYQVDSSIDKFTKLNNPATMPGYACKRSGFGDDYESFGLCTSNNTFLLMYGVDGLEIPPPEYYTGNGHNLIPSLPHDIAAGLMV